MCVRYVVLDIPQAFIIPLFHSGEPGIDEGGPKHEFFMLLLNAISNNSSLLDGSPTRRVLRHNTTAFQVASWSTSTFILLYHLFLG